MGTTNLAKEDKQSYLLNDENIVTWYWSIHGRVSQKEVQQLQGKK